MLEVVEYETEDGRNFFRKWFKNLPAQHADKVAQAIRRMEAGNLGDHKSVGGGVFEHRIHTPALRIYFGREGRELVILLAGGDKTQQSRDIERALILWEDHKRNS